MLEESNKGKVYKVESECFPYSTIPRGNCYSPFGVSLPIFLCLYKQFYITT